LPTIEKISRPLPQLAVNRKPFGRREPASKIRLHADVAKWQTQRT